MSQRHHQIIQYDNDKDLDNNGIIGTYGAGEDWITKRKVETTTTKNVERKIQRQVVLEDGRVIEEDVPEITVDTTEDIRTDEDDVTEGKNMVPAYYTSPLARSWVRGDKILSEKCQTNINTKALSENSITTASGTNLGDLSVKDIDKVVQQGRSVKSLVRAYDTEDDLTSAVALQSQILSQSANRRKTVDKENIREINHIHDGKVRTDRFVTREVIEDKDSDTPEGGSSDDESVARNGDVRHFSNRKEDRFIDYYKVPKGKSYKEGTKIGRGIHMTSSDRNDNTRFPSSNNLNAIGYQQESDNSTSYYGGGSLPRPPRRQQYPSPARRNLAPPPSVQKRRSLSANRPSSFRSRSISQSSREETPPQEPSPTKRSHIPDHLDKERFGRLKRSLSFTNRRKSNTDLSTASSHSNLASNNSNLFSKKSFLGSMKNLYNSFQKATHSIPSNHNPQYNTVNRVSAANKAWFDQGDGASPPTRPPRRYNSGTLSTTGSTHDGMNNRRRRTDSRPASSVISAYSAPTTTSSYRNQRERQRSKSPYSSSTLGRITKQFGSLGRRHAAPTEPPPPAPTQTPPPTAPKPSSGVILRHNKNNKSGGIERRKTFAAYDNNNRDRPIFEPERHRNSRFFGQNEDDEVDVRARPPPDMRRHLLNGVNESRRKSMSKGLESKPRVIRAV